WKGLQRDASRGWAHTFLTQMEEVLGTCVDRGIKVATTAGGLNPAGLADQVGRLADRLGLAVSVAHIEGDDLLPRVGELRADGHPLAPLDTGVPLERAEGPVVSPKAYLGAWPIVEALNGGADVVVCPRITDASLVVGPAAWHHGWGPTEWGRLAGEVVPGSATMAVEQQARDRVRISGVRGLPAPPEVKVCLNLLGGWRNAMTFVLTGLDIEEKAALTLRSLEIGRAHV